MNETVRLVVLSSVLNMPRGTLVPEENRRTIAHLLERHGTWVLENDSHTDLAFEARMTPFRDLLDPDRLIVYSTFEKTIGPEAPYGYVLSRQLTLHLQRHFLLRAFRLSPIRQKAIARLYSNGRIDQHLLVLRRLLRESAVSTTQLLRERLGIACNGQNLKVVRRSGCSRRDGSTCDGFSIGCLPSESSSRRGSCSASRACMHNICA